MCCSTCIRLCLHKAPFWSNKKLKSQHLGRGIGRAGEQREYETRLKREKGERETPRPSSQASANHREEAVTAGHRMKVKPKANGDETG